MDEPTDEIVVGVLVAELPEPYVAGSVQDACCLCERAVWVAPAAQPIAARGVVLCLSCSTRREVA